MVKLFFIQPLDKSRLIYELFSVDGAGRELLNQLAGEYFQLCPSAEDADWVFIPYLLSSLIDEPGKMIVKEHAACARKFQKPLAIVSDSDLIYDPGVKDIFILTPGPYASMEKQLAIPAILPQDPIVQFYGGEWTAISDFSSYSMGFCGQATQHLLKTVKDTLNLRILKRQIRKKQAPYLYAPFFLAAYERAKLLGFIQKESRYKTDFLLRKKYKAGAETSADKVQVEKEFFENIYQNLFTVCMRGFGNYSVRFYQTMAMGRIPILIDTDNILPFEKAIEYGALIVRVPFSDRHNIDHYIDSFLTDKSPEDLIAIQKSCREVWLSSLTLSGVFRELAKEFIQISENER